MNISIDADSVRLRYVAESGFIGLLTTLCPNRATARIGMTAAWVIS